MGLLKSIFGGKKEVNEELRTTPDVRNPPTVKRYTHQKTTNSVAGFPCALAVIEQVQKTSTRRPLFQI